MRFLVLALFILFSFPSFAQLTHESELAYLQSGGNSDVQTGNAKTTNIYKWTLNQVRFGGHYTYGESDDTVSARNWDANARYERELGPHLSATAGEVIEGNRFTGIKTRYNSDAGVKYYYIKSDMKNFFSEVGYRYTIEDRYSPIENVYDNKGRLYNEFNQKVSETFQWRVWLEYIPNFTAGTDYLINGEISGTSIINSVFSLKVAYTGMYDNLPATPELKNYDYATTTSLVAKF